MMSLENIILGIPAILLAISFHELGHAFVAYRLGDPTPKYQGRLTLNPLAHLDPIGTLMLLIFRVGWARPVMINADYFKNRKQGTLLVSLAGPMANVFLAWIFYNILQFSLNYLPSGSLGRSVFMFFIMNIQVNLGLAAFNLLPIPPLDGSHILASFLPPRLAYTFAKWAPYGPLVLMLLLLTGRVAFIINPIYNALSQILIRLSF